MMSFYFSVHAWRQWRNDFDNQRWWTFVDAPGSGMDDRNWIIENCSGSAIYTNDAFYFKKAEDAVLFKLARDE